MRLTAYTDITLRILMQLGFNRDRLVTIQSIAGLHGNSRNHLMNVVHQLGYGKTDATWILANIASSLPKRRREITFYVRHVVCL